jgi:Na+-translocating ferredoxin:NAD+ oxidoreductase RnfG subunit
MRTTIHWIALPAVAVGAACPAWAVTYLSIEQAQQAIFPQARLQKIGVQLTPDQRKAIEKTSGVKVRATKFDVWKVEGGGWFLVDEVVGKHEFITFALGLDRDGSVKQIEVMDYRENYGGEVRRPEWRAQFAGKKHGSKLKLDEDIKSISGATLSCRHLTEGVKRLLATYDIALKEK